MDVVHILDFGNVTLTQLQNLRPDEAFNFGFSLVAYFAPVLVLVSVLVRIIRDAGDD